MPRFSTISSGFSRFRQHPISRSVSQLLLHSRGVLWIGHSCALCTIWFIWRTWYTMNFCHFTRFWHSQESLLLLHLFKLRLVKVFLTKTSGQPFYIAPNNFQNFFSTCENFFFHFVALITNREFTGMVLRKQSLWKFCKKSYSQNY